ncbi:helix-turn-helix transcriptional regulator [Streptomyces cylindrosporus]|uniref:Helix-turn-helix transcriptional regulator n=1 Tax=Streptomyces cylindrosporus TaxID=2927583 RepID=A0ABS9Y3Y3_9ACTN|nr:helix-turn-helix transcriptional regulator [Streptomyces cylindrosporus]MCI3271225.1 helix-turn-helix transcriptional regulator [Streptomyces cylindrosporus]
MAATPVPDPGRKALGAFLRSRRERADPEGTGLPPGGRRRTPGLRREEVSLLSGVSLTWYTWLEQGRDINVSPQILLALARALQLDEVERAHLFRLAGLPAPKPAERSLDVPHAVRGFLDTLLPNPAFVIDRCFDVLAWNSAQEEILGSALLDRPRRELNSVWLLFREPRVRALMPEWEAEARWLAGLLRQQAAYELDNPRFTELVDELLATSEEFAALWEQHDVVEFRSSVRRYRHPVVGDLEVSYVRMALEEAPWLSLICHFPEPGSESEGRLRKLVTLPG